MKETELKLHPCYCGGEMKIKKVAQNSGMDGTYWNWKIICSKCGLTKTYAADGFYGRKYMTLEEVVDDWNKKKEEITKSLEQQTCEDAVSRQAVLDALDKSKYSNEFCEEHHIDWSVNLGMAHIVVNKLKPVTPESKIGHWIDMDGDNAICGCCNRLNHLYGTYCKHCGARMIEPQER